jgi:hypothetical protein
MDASLVSTKKRLCHKGFFYPPAMYIAYYKEVASNIIVGRCQQIPTGGAGTTDEGWVGVHKCYTLLSYVL